MIWAFQEWFSHVFPESEVVLQNCLLWDGELCTALTSYPWWQLTVVTRHHHVIPEVLDHGPSSMIVRMSTVKVEHGICVTSTALALKADVSLIIDGRKIQGGQSIEDAFRLVPGSFVTMYEYYVLGKVVVVIDDVRHVGKCLSAFRVLDRKVVCVVVGGRCIIDVAVNFPT